MALKDRVIFIPRGPRGLTGDQLEIHLPNLVV